MIDFNVPPFAEKSAEYIQEACKANHKQCGDGPFTKRVTDWLTKKTGAGKVLLTTSCSHALDMMGLLAGLKTGDEVIIPSYNFVSAANAVAMRGATCVFTDIRPDTMNLDENKIKAAINDKTKAIFPMQYAGVACEMDAINEMAKQYGLLVLEDAAQGMMATYQGKALGTLADFGTYSFHETKNYSMGEGGCLFIMDEKNVERAEILREKGTDRSKFWRGQVDKYTWQDVGSSYLPSDINAAFLAAQLESADEMNARRIAIWNRYHDAFAKAEKSGRITRPFVPEGCVHNGHMYYIKLKNLADRTAFINHMKENGVMCVFHYIPLHTAPAGKKYGRFEGTDTYTTAESEKLVRLPLHYDLTDAQQTAVIDAALKFLK